MNTRPRAAGAGLVLALVLTLACPVAASNASGTVQSLDSVRAAAVQAIRSHYAQPGSRSVVTAEPLDLRLQLTACQQPLRVIIPDQLQARSRMSVAVRCPQPEGWTVRVPIQLQLFRSVLVTSRALLRGDGIGAADVHAEQRDVTRLGYGYIDNFQQIAGRSLARAMAPGTPLNPGALGGRHMVRAGDHVQMVAQLGGIEVRAEGLALGSGDNGARLRVRNASSGRVVDAIVSAPGLVTVLP